MDAERRGWEAWDQRVEHLVSPEGLKALNGAGTNQKGIDWIFMKYAPADAVAVAVRSRHFGAYTPWHNVCFTIGTGELIKTESYGTHNKIKIYWAFTGVWESGISLVQPWEIRDAARRTRGHDDDCWFDQRRRLYFVRARLGRTMEDVFGPYPEEPLELDEAA